MCQSVSPLITVGDDFLPHCRPNRLSIYFLLIALLSSIPHTQTSHSLHCLIPSSAPLSTFHSPDCCHSLTLEHIDLQPEWAGRPRLDIQQCDLGACMPGRKGGRETGIGRRETVRMEMTSRPVSPGRLVIATGRGSKRSESSTHFSGLLTRGRHRLTWAKACWPRCREGPEKALSGTALNT